MPPDDAAVLLDIAYSARRLVTVTEPVDWERFRVDESAQEPVLYRLIILGEAVKRLTPAFRTQHGEVNWAAVAGLRDYSSMPTSE